MVISSTVESRPCIGPAGGGRRAGGSTGIQAQWAMLGKECSTASVAFSRLHNLHTDLTGQDLGTVL